MHRGCRRTAQAAMSPISLLLFFALQTSVFPKPAERSRLSKLEWAERQARFGDYSFLCQMLCESVEEESDEDDGCWDYSFDGSLFCEGLCGNDATTTTKRPAATKPIPRPSKTPQPVSPKNPTALTTVRPLVPASAAPPAVPTQPQPLPPPTQPSVPTVNPAPSPFQNPTAQPPLVQPNPVEPNAPVEAPVAPLNAKLPAKPGKATQATSTEANSAKSSVPPVSESSQGTDAETTNAGDPGKPTISDFEAETLTAGGTKADDATEGTQSTDAADSTEADDADTSVGNKADSAAETTDTDKPVEGGISEELVGSADNLDELVVAAPTEESEVLLTSTKSQPEYYLTLESTTQNDMEPVTISLKNKLMPYMPELMSIWCEYRSKFPTAETAAAVAKLCPSAVPYKDRPPSALFDLLMGSSLPPV